MPLWIFHRSSGESLFQLNLTLKSVASKHTFLRGPCSAYSKFRSDLLARFGLDRLPSLSGKSPWRRCRSLKTKASRRRDCQVWQIYGLRTAICRWNQAHGTYFECLWFPSKRTISRNVSLRWPSHEPDWWPTDVAVQSLLWLGYWSDLKV